MSNTFYDRVKNPEIVEEPIIETPQEEIKTPEVAEEAPVVEEKKEEIQTEAPKEEPKGFDINSVNEYYGKSFEDADSLKTIFESQEKWKDFETQLAERDGKIASAQEQYDSLIDSIDPEKVLPNKEAVALSQLAEKFPSADLGMLSEIRKMDLGTVNKLDALVMLDKLKLPSNISDAVRKAEILNDLNIDVEDLNELTETDNYRIEKAFTKEAASLEEIKSFQPEYNKFDFEAAKTERQSKFDLERTALKGHNEKALDILLNSYTETKSTYKNDGKDQTYSFKVADDFKSEQFENILNRMTEANIKVTQENANEIMTEIDNMYWLQNRHSIVQDAIKQQLAQNKEQNHQEMHSDSEINKTEAPTGAPPPPKTIRESFMAGEMTRK